MRGGGWVAPIVRRLVPREFADDLADDLLENWALRAEQRGRIAAAGWLVRELLGLPLLGLRRQAARLRLAGVRREAGPPPAGGSGVTLAGLRIAFRSLSRRPTYFGVAVATLAVSVGAATLIFSVFEGVVLRPLPYEDGERLYQIYGTNAAFRDQSEEILRLGWNRLPVSEDMLDVWRTSVPAIERLGGFYPITQRWDDDFAPVEAAGAYVLPGFFETLGMSTVVGRLPGAQEMESGAPVLVIGERFWSSRYASDPGVLGSAITLGGVAYRIVGVLPRAFAVPDELTAWWAPQPADFADGRTDQAVHKAFAVLVASARADEVETAMNAAMARLVEADPANANLGGRLVPLRDVVVGPVGEGIRLLLASVLAVVLIACVNLANLVVARGARRRSELAVRSALGASRRDLMWAMLSETAVMGVVGGLLGVLLAVVAKQPFLSLLEQATPGFPRADNVGLNGLVLGFALAVSALTLLLAGLLPALAAARRGAWATLREGGRGSASRGTRRTQGGLLLTEAALAVVLLVVAGLLTRSSLFLVRVDTGYDDARVGFLDLRPSTERYPSQSDVQVLADDIQRRIARLPGVEVVGRTKAVPGLGGGDMDLIWPNGASMDDAQLRTVAKVSAGYFQSMGIEVLAGRAFSEQDGPDDEDVAVLSERMARTLFGSDDPLGRTVYLGTGTRLEAGRVVADGERPLRVVGVVEDVRHMALVMDPDAVLYLPIAQTSTRDQSVVFRVRGDPATALDMARAAALEADPGLLVSRAGVLRTAMRGLVAPIRVRTLLVVALASLAAFLTVVGIYGVVAYVVSDRVREIGVRMALGAGRGREVSRMVVGALRPVLLGAGVGLVAAFYASRVVEGVLYGVESFDAATYVAVLGVLASAAALAAWVPARRAAAVDPVRVLSD